MINTFFSAKLKADFEATYNTIELVDSTIVWAKYIYDSKTMDNMYNALDCSFICKNVEKNNACDLFAFEDHNCYFGKSGHTTGEVSEDLVDATIYITNCKFLFGLFMTKFSGLTNILTFIFPYQLV